MIISGVVAGSTGTGTSGGGGSSGGGEGPVGSTTLPNTVVKTEYGDGRTVYHHGTLFDGATPNHLGAYVENGESVPAHYWNSRWTKRTNPLSIVRNPAAIVAARRMFPFGATGATVGSATTRVPYSIMGSSSVTKYMPTTGERADIGLTTDPAADFMLGRSELPMLDWAQANDSCPLHFRDETTGKPINLLTYPRANAYSQHNQGDPWLLRGPIVNGYPKFGGDWTPQQAHFCEMSYLAHEATLDLGFLENVQYNANFVVLIDASKSNASRAIPSGEYRGLAWAFRNLFMAHIATKDAEDRGDLPATCHPSSYWKTILDNTLAYYDDIMSVPAAQTFRLIQNPTRFGPWQADYMLMALAFGVLTGHSDWEPLYRWCLGNPISRMSGNAGIPPGLGCGYYMDTNGGNWTWRQSFDNMVLDPTTSLTQAQHDALLANPLNGDEALKGDEYMMTTRAVLTAADYLDGLGLSDVRGEYADFDTALTNAQTMFANHGSVHPRTAVISP